MTAVEVIPSESPGTQDCRRYGLESFAAYTTLLWELISA